MYLAFNHLQAVGRDRQSPKGRLELTVEHRHSVKVHWEVTTISKVGRSTILAITFQLKCYPNSFNRIKPSLLDLLIIPTSFYYKFHRPSPLFGHVDLQRRLGI